MRLPPCLHLIVLLLLVECTHAQQAVQQGLVGSPLKLELTPSIYMFFLVCRTAIHCTCFLAAVTGHATRNASCVWNALLRVYWTVEKSRGCSAAVGVSMSLESQHMLLQRSLPSSCGMHSCGPVAYMQPALAHPTVPTTLPSVGSPDSDSVACFFKAGTAPFAGTREPWMTWRTKFPRSKRLLIRCQSSGR
eukprot:TRINITY_DN7255_c0_g1_i6.p1 TRINITY_DN7255_c0_g1~~TRINITY_DN7255_c0_g1_i6.p1  ORF type:complete len:219 (+),score=16.38 TRINITY_DN7255_c0_g1_i6:86-658(+)